MPGAVRVAISRVHPRQLSCRCFASLRPRSNARPTYGSWDQVKSSRQVSVFSRPQGPEDRSLPPQQTPSPEDNDTWNRVEKRARDRKKAEGWWKGPWQTFVGLPLNQKAYLLLVAAALLLALPRLLEVGLVGFERLVVALLLGVESVVEVALLGSARIAGAIIGVAVVLYGLHIFVIEPRMKR